jgi:hypothetical protein
MHSLDVGNKYKMDSVKILIIAFFVLLIASLVLSSTFGIAPIALVWNIVLPALIIAIHIMCSVALFREAKIRMENRIKVFADLDPVFWGLVGLVFGILGLLSYRVINDYFTSKANQPEQDNPITRP